jgi:hypothetical protein
MDNPSSIGSLNLLPPDRKRDIYRRIIPPELLSKFEIAPGMYDSDGQDLLQLHCKSGTSQAELALYHTGDAPDPILFGHITDNLQGHLHILLYGMNDPRTKRYNVDRMPDGEKTRFGTNLRNIPEEIKALNAGLAPGQIYRGPHLFKESLRQFESFVTGLGQDLFFAEPLYYHVALLFERYGFLYQTGKKLMREIEAGFAPNGDLHKKLDGSNPFRQEIAADRIRLRSWAIHDNILGRAFSGVTMYKHITDKPISAAPSHLPY